LSLIRDFRLLAEEATFQLRSDRSDFQPWGVEGGKPGTPTRNYLNPDTDRQELPGKHLMTLKKGDVYRVIQAGGGGYGDPLDRDVYAVLEDVQQEKLSVDHVRQEYGVVINPDGLKLDLTATEALRAEMREGSAGTSG
jgi:N-methylhydantoinase B